MNFMVFEFATGKIVALDSDPVWWMEKAVQRMKVYGLAMDEIYFKVPKFLDARKICCNLSLPKFQTKRPNLRSFRQKME